MEKKGNSLQKIRSTIIIKIFSKMNRALFLEVGIEVMLLKFINNLNNKIQRAIFIK
jgi:hypothetical protein